MRCKIFGKSQHHIFLLGIFRIDKLRILLRNYNQNNHFNIENKLFAGSSDEHISETLSSSKISSLSKD